MRSRLAAQTVPLAQSLSIMADVHRLTVPGRLERLAQIVDFISKAAYSAGFNEDDVFHIQMAVDEACTNIIEHAYGDNKQGDISVVCVYESHAGLRIEIRDNGTHFDPNNVPVPTSITSNTNLDEVDVGGLGIFFMQKLMDKVEFAVDDQGNNVLVMVKRRSD